MTEQGRFGVARPPLECALCILPSRDGRHIQQILLHYPWKVGMLEAETRTPPFHHAIKLSAVYHSKSEWGRRIYFWVPVSLRHLIFYCRPLSHLTLQYSSLQVEDFNYEAIYLYFGGATFCYSHCL